MSPPEPEKPMSPPRAAVEEPPSVVLDPALEALVAEMRRAKDMNHWAVATEQSPPHFVRFSRKAGLPEKYDRVIGVGLCFLGDSRAREAANRAFAERYIEELPNGATRLLPVPLDIPGERRLSSLTATERRKLCAWNIEHSITWLQPGGDPRLNEAGAQMRLEDFVECTQRFPECPATLDEILPCMSDAQRGAPAVHASFSTATCLERAECLWGFEFGTAAAPLTVPPAF